jgi:hypothetical protein
MGRHSVHWGIAVMTLTMHLDKYPTPQRRLLSFFKDIFYDPPVTIHARRDLYLCAIKLQILHFVYFFFICVVDHL